MEWDGERPKEEPSSGGMLSGVSGLSELGISGAARAGLMDLSPNRGIPGLAWLGIAAAIVALAVLLWSWLFGH